MPNIYNELLQQEILDNFPQLNTELQLNILNNILTKYNISLISLYTNEYIDLQEKIKLFITGKKLEGLSPLTLEGYKLELSIFAKHIQKKVEDITINDIRMYLSKWDNLKPSSLSRRISVLKSFFSWLTSEEIIPKDPTRKIKNPKKEKRLPKALTIEELEMIRESCKTLRERAMVEVFYATGCRLSEIYNINRFTDIDWRNMKVKVVGKGHKERYTYFGYKVVFHLKKYLNSRIDDDPALFITERKPYRKLSKRGIQREIKIIAKRCGLEEKVHVHTYRHTLATNLLNNGSDISTVSEILGHVDVSTTQIYAQVTNEHISHTYKKCFVQ